MRPAYAYLGIGLILLFVIITFVNHDFTGPQDNETKVPMATSTLMLTSSAFEANASIPSIYTCDGTQVSPPLTISGAPQGTQSFALIVEDPDVPKQVSQAGVFVHWVLFNIPASITEITAGALVGTPGANSAGKNVYAGPCPPAQYNPNEHRYFFTLYALNNTLSLKAGASKDEVEKAMQGHVLAQAQLMGKYKKK